MKLIDLDPHFIRYEIKNELVNRLKPGIDPLRGNWTEDDLESVVAPVKYLHHVDTLSEAQGVYFLCPKCFAANAGSIGTHGVEVTFSGRGVSDEDGTHTDAGQPVRWGVSGTGYGDLTTTPSILLTGGGCAWHGFITNGEVT